MKKGVRVGLLVLLISAVLVVLVAALVIYAGSPGSLVEDWYQAGVDPVRVEHVNHIAGLVEKYRERTGRWPLAEHYAGVPIVVIVTTRSADVRFYEEQGPPATYFSRDTLQRTLRSVLGDSVELPDDPQSVVNSGRPNVYLYKCTGDDYFVAGHLYAATDLTRPVGPFYNKYEVGSTANKARKIHRYIDVCDDSPDCSGAP